MGLFGCLAMKNNFRIIDWKSGFKEENLDFRAL
jgi:hypothetical protein